MRYLRTVAAVLCLVATVIFVPATARAGTKVGAPVVVIGVAGLSWDDVSPVRTPALWRLLGRGAAAGAATIPVGGKPSCPSDGWLSLSAGRPAEGPRDDTGGCAPSPGVSAGGGAARVTNWPELVDAQRGSEFAPRPGSLGDALAARGVCATAVGPGAALALAGHDGTVGRYRAAFGDDALGCPITVIDAGPVAAGSPRLSADRLVEQVVDRAGAGTSVLVQSVAEPPGERALGVTLLAVPSAEAALLTASSTRWDGVVRLLDVPSTLLNSAGVAEPADFSGAPITAGGPRPTRTTATVHRLAEITTAGRVARRWTVILPLTAAGAQLLLYAAILRARAGRKGRDDRADASRGGRRRWRPAVLFLAAVPVSAYLVTLTRWWRAPAPDLALGVGVVAIALAIAAVVARLPWRPAAAVSLLTWIVLVADAVTGTTLHRNSPFGPTVLYGGRFYGFGNTTFAVFAVCTLVLAGSAAAALIDRGRRRAATGAVLAIGALAVLIDVWPAWGADVGGGLALTPGVAVLAFGVAGVRMTAARLAGASAIGIAVVALAALFDWSRPPAARSHAGRFVQQAIDGDAWQVIGRKAGYALTSLTVGPTAWITTILLAATVLMLARPGRFSPAGLTAAARRLPTLRPVLIAMAVTAVIGAAVNDYGIKVVSFIFIVAVPLTVMTCTERRQGL